MARTVEMCYGLGMNQRLANAGKKYTKRCFMAFLEGQPKCTEEWLKGVIRASMSDDIIGALNSLASYPNRERLELLRRACGVA